jgi:hypothetical protein
LAETPRNDTLDAGADGPRVAEGGAAEAGPPAAFCSERGAALYCEDFDTRRLDASFVRLSEFNGSLSRTSKVFVSPGHSLEARLDPGNLATRAVGALELETPGVLVAEIKVRIDERPTEEGSMVSLLKLGFGEPRQFAAIVAVARPGDVDPGGVDIGLYQNWNLGAGGFRAETSLIVPDRQWTTLELEVDVPARAVSLRRINPNGSREVISSVALTLVGAPAERWIMNVGLEGNGYDYQVWRAQLDDVLVQSR